MLCCVLHIGVRSIEKIIFSNAISVFRDVIMNKESFKKGGGKLAIISFVFIVASLLVLTQSFPLPRLVQDEQGFSHIVWDGSNIVSATENSTIGAAASGFLEIFFVNHSADPRRAYDTNTSSLFETWANASLDPDAAGTTYKAYATYSGFSLTLKWGTAFDIVVRYRGNATNAKNATIFNNASCRVKINATGGGIELAGATTGLMTNVNSSNATDHTFIWINAYLNNNHAGYTLNKGGTCTITNIKIEFNY